MSGSCRVSKNKFWWSKVSKNIFWGGFLLKLFVEVADERWSYTVGFVLSQSNISLYGPDSCGDLKTSSVCPTLILCLVFSFTVTAGTRPWQSMPSNFLNVSLQLKIKLTICLHFLLQHRQLNSHTLFNQVTINLFKMQFSEFCSPITVKVILINIF